MEDVLNEKLSRVVIYIKNALNGKCTERFPVGNNVYELNYEIRFRSGGTRPENVITSYCRRLYLVFDVINIYNDPNFSEFSNELNYAIEQRIESNLMFIKDNGCNTEVIYHTNERELYIGVWVPISGLDQILKLLSFKVEEAFNSFSDIDF
jgi:hypothetical protein